jgi:hypothetical protein
VVSSGTLEQRSQGVQNKRQAWQVQRRARYITSASLSSLEGVLLGRRACTPRFKFRSTPSLNRERVHVNAMCAASRVRAAPDSALVSRPAAVVTISGRPCSGRGDGRVAVGRCRWYTLKDSIPRIDVFPSWSISLEIQKGRSELKIGTGVFLVDQSLLLDLTSW